MFGFRFLFGRHLLLALLACALAPRGWAQQPDSTQWRALIEPKFMRPEVSFPISGAERTVLVPGYFSENEVHYFSQKDWQALGLDWPAFQTKAAENATNKTVKVELVRDRQKVIQYAALTSESPLTATAVLSPDFLKKFADVFGAKLLVAVPNRFTVFVFPALASNYKDYAPMILEAYHATAYPVSVEIFELSTAGLRAIGTFEE